MFATSATLEHVDIVNDSLRDSNLTFAFAINNTSISKEESHVGMARVLLKKYIEGCGCPQPHRPKVRRKEDVFDTIPTVLLPMNTRKLDILALINEELATLGKTCAIRKCAFYAFWRSDFPHVKISRTSRFSKCYVCWEYTSGLEALTNERMKYALKRQYCHHHTLIIEERQAYREARVEAARRLDHFISLIVDGMDQNTTMVPKLRQTVKNIEGAT